MKHNKGDFKAACENIANKITYIQGEDGWKVMFRCTRLMRHGTFTNSWWCDDIVNKKDMKKYGKDLLALFDWYEDPLFIMRTAIDEKDCREGWMRDYAEKGCKMLRDNRHKWE